MKTFLSLLFLVTIFLNAQPMIPVTIIDDHIEDYESTTFKICFDSNADLKSLEYVDYLSSIARPDIQSVLESFYMSSKFESKDAMRGKCMLSTTFQVNSKYEHAVANVNDCKKFEDGIFIYGKNNITGTIIRRVGNKQSEFSYEGELTAEVERMDECSYTMFNPHLENYMQSGNDIRLDSRIIHVKDEKLLIVSNIGNERHFLEMIKVNSMNLRPENSYLQWKGFKVLDEITGHNGTVHFKDAVLEFEKGKIKYFNAVIDLRTITNSDIKNRETVLKLEGHLKSEDFFETEKFPFATFRFLGAENEDNKIKINGIFNIKGISNPISFYAQIKESRKNVKIVTDDIKLNLSDYNITFNNTPMKIIQDEFVVRFKMEFEK